MYIGLAHILVEQGLQNIGVFAYADVLHEEVDLQINKKLFNLIEDAFDPDKKSKHPFQVGQSILDKFQNLQLKNVPFSPTLEDDHYYILLPDDYVHLISDASLVLKLDNMTPIVPGKVQKDLYYYVLGEKTIVYNGNSYVTNQYFKGEDGITGYTFSGTGTLKLVQLRNWKKANRLQEEEFIYQVSDNKLTNTTFKSPLSSVSGNKLYVYQDGTFIIDKFYLNYVREPKEANYNFTRYASGDTLVIGKKYESIDDPITFNSVEYKKFTPFFPISGHQTYSGSGVVREVGDGDLELSDTMSYDLVSEVINELLIMSEQSQQKIVNTAQKED